MSEQTLASFTATNETTTATTENVDRASNHSEPTWFFADGVPGQGERPDYLEPKYKSVSEQAKAYKEAQKLLGAQSGAPESYDFSGVQEFIDPNNQHIQEFALFAKENKLSQDVFARSLQSFVEYDKSRQPDVDQEIAKLGNDGMQKVTTVQNWVKNNLSSEAVKALEKLPVRAEVITMLDEIRQLHTHTQAKIPAGEKTENSFVPLSVQEVETEMLQNYTRYQNDPGYRAQIAAKFEQAVG